MTEEKFVLEFHLKKFVSVTQLVCFGGSRIKHFHDNVFVVDFVNFVIFVVFGVNRKFLLNYVALRNL